LLFFEQVFTWQCRIQVLTVVTSASERRTDVDIQFTDVVMRKGMSGLQLAYLAHQLRPDLKVAIGTE